MSTAPEVSLGVSATQPHPIFGNQYEVVDHADLSAIVGVLRRYVSYELNSFSSDVVLFCESGVLFLLRENGKSLKLQCGDALWIPKDWEFCCYSGFQGPARISIYTFGDIGLLMPTVRMLSCEKVGESIQAKDLANGNFDGCLVASVLQPLRQDSFFANFQRVLFDSDEARNAAVLGGRKLKAGILFWGKNQDGSAERAQIHRHGPNHPVTELIRIATGNMEAWYAESWAQRALITIRGWVWHSWRWMEGNDTPLPEDWLARFGSACDNKHAVMFFIYAEGGKESKGDTTGAPPE